jgi:cyclopropane-fatty-acyl-phospholipid synthase
MSTLDTLLARGWIPDPLVRSGIRHLLSAKLREEARGDLEERGRRFAEFRTGLDASPIAIRTADANVQHYQVPTEFYLHVLGPRLKYSSGYWPSEHTTFAESEEAMLELTCSRACLADGQNILELGCGWGSLTLWMAERYPRATITAVSNSYTQRLHIESEALRRELYNVRVLTADMNVFSPPEPGAYDRVVSVAMFEHMKNYRELMRRIASWLKPGGKLFVHIFTHREHAYHFEGRDPSDWITRYFFSGGTLPSHHLLLYFQEDLRIEQDWLVSGTHYARTSEAWLHAMDANRKILTPVLEKTYGVAEAPKRRAYWRTFFMSCAELWGYRGGEEWIVSHYLFRK